mmetsp:Transcript_24392/g.44768  ORF Transcript_24392/g.44768 Transcript_24392/m.44768 type:complete len:146 (+) Transcript_24392:107-544(+)
MTTGHGEAAEVPDEGPSFSQERLSKEARSLASFIASIVAFASWLIWVLLPDSHLQEFGGGWFPDKRWALAVPTLLVIALFCIVCAYNALNMMASVPITSIDMIKDGSTTVTSEFFRKAGCIPELEDVDLTVVNEHLFLTSCSSRE